jgi:hypothetical protein
MLLAFDSVVSLGSESHHILLSQIWDFPFRRLLRLVGSRWRYSTPPPHGLWSIYLSVCLSMAVQSFRWALAAFHLLILCTAGRTPRTGDRPVARPLPAHRTAQTQNKSRQTSIPWVAFESMIPMFEWAKTVQALDRAATVIGPHYNLPE